MSDLKQNTRIEFNTQGIIGKGKIVGIGANDLPIIGKMYIIEPDEKIKSMITHILWRGVDNSINKDG